MRKELDVSLYNERILQIEKNLIDLRQGLEDLMISDDAANPVLVSMAFYSATKPGGDTLNNDSYIRSDLSDPKDPNPLTRWWAFGGRLSHDGLGKVEFAYGLNRPIRRDDLYGKVVGFQIQPDGDDKWDAVFVYTTFTFSNGKSFNAVYGAGRPYLPVGNQDGYYRIWDISVPAEFLDQI